MQKRTFLWYWRSPVYIRSKVILNLLAGLFLGFTFYKEPSSAQGLQNKMFAAFTSLVVSARQSVHDPIFSENTNQSPSVDEPTPTTLFRDP